MNVTELARKIKLTTQELLQILPEYGFDIGKKAIKVDDKVARKIMELGPRIKDKMEADKKRQLEELRKLTKETNLQAAAEIQIPPVITVRDFSSLIKRPVNEVIKELMKNGVLASLNERIDFETAAIIADEFGVKLVMATDSEVKEATDGRIKEIIAHEEQQSLQTRPPVVVVMGHVDHGKTKLLDAIRRTNVMEGEAGGITQHIGAYQAKRKNHIITFIDTPGHEAFTAMRSRGAKIADIAILVVAANDSVKPQTVEAIKIIQQAKVPMVVAINKIDLPDANIEKVKQDLSSLGLIPEDWGGKTIMVPISAKANLGIDDLLENLILVAEMEKDKILANPDSQAVGTIIESHINKGEGPVATVLVQNGTLKKGDNLCVDDVFLGKARALKNFTNQDIDQAEPSVPVKIIGLKYAPKVGDIVAVTSVVERKHKKAKAYELQKEDTIINAAKQSEEDSEAQEVKKYNLIIKADVLGSLEVIGESLEKIYSPEIKVKVVSKGLGNITDADIAMAEGSRAVIIGFNVKAGHQAEDLARDKNVSIKYYNVIYKLLEDVKAELSKLLSPEIVKKDLGRVEVLAIFKTENKSMVVGGKVKTGKIIKGAKVDVVRKKEIIASGEISELQSGKQVVNEVVSDQDCGMTFVGQPVIQVGDSLEVYQEEKIIKEI